MLSHVVSGGLSPNLHSKYNSMIHRMGFETGIDINKIIDTAK